MFRRLILAAALFFTASFPAMAAPAAAIAETFTGKVDGVKGWLSSGYDPRAIKDPKHMAWIEKYQKRFGEEPTWSSLNGYMIYQFIFGAIEKAGTMDSEAITKALKGLVVEGPMGPVEMQAHTHRSTMGVWVGALSTEEGRPRLGGDVRHVSGATHLPTPDEVEANIKAKE